MELVVVALCLLILALSAVGISIAAFRTLRPSVQPLVQTYQRPRSSRRQHQKKQQSAHEALQARLVESQVKANRQLQRRLYSMTIDQATALRLIQGLKTLEPGRPENWYWEKAIDDLERDRR